MVKTADGDISMKNKENPRREAERTETYVSIHDGGFDAVVREIAPSADNRDIWMQNAKAPLFR